MTARYGKDERIFLRYRSEQAGARKKTFSRLFRAGNALVAFVQRACVNDVLLVNFIIRADRHGNSVRAQVFRKLAFRIVAAAYG